MTRGKQAIAAANRRARDAVETDLTTYQRKVVELTKERDELRDTLARVRAESAELIRRLRAERDEAAGPQVAALRLKLERAQIDSQQHKAKVAQELRRVLNRYNVTFPKHHQGAALDAISNLLGASMFPSDDGASRESRRISSNRQMKLNDLVTGGTPDGDPGAERLRQKNERARRRALSERMAEKIRTDISA